MLSGRIQGHATSTVKHPTLTGWKLLIVQPDDGGDPVLAIDSLGAGPGMEVLISSDGKFTAQTVGTQATPIRWSVIGIRDEAAGGRRQEAGDS